MSLMLRLLMITASSFILVFGATNNTTELKIEKFLSNSIRPNPNIKVLRYKIVKTVDLKNIPGWKAYILKINLKLLTQNNRIITIKDILFSNGKYISRGFVNLKTKKNIKDSILKSFSIDADKSYYDNKHLLYGDKNAKYKVLVFSDPNCPFCAGFVPGLIKFVKKHPKNFALYYYDLPLIIHPTSSVVVKALIAGREKGYKNLYEKVYGVDLNLNTTNPKIILDKFNKDLHTNITLKDIQSKKVLDVYNNDLKKSNKLMVDGTPTVYINGKLDFYRDKIAKLMNEYK